MLVVMSRKPKTFVHNLVLIDLDTMKRGAMTDSTTNDTDPMWSPDGKWVLYRSSAVDPDATTWQEWQKTVKPTEEIYILDVVEGTRFPITRAHGEAKPVGWINDLTAVTMLPGAEVDSLYTQWVKDVASGKLPAATGVGAVPHGARPPGLLAVSTAAYPSGSLVFAMEKNGESGIYIRGYQQTKNTPVIRGAPAPDPPKR